MNNERSMIRNEDAKLRPGHTCRKLPAAKAVRPSGTWTYPSSSHFVVPYVMEPAPAARTRRVYADYRELLALESQARKWNFLGSDSAPSLTPDWQTLLQDQEPCRFEHTGKTVLGPLDPPVPGPAARNAILIVDQRINMFFGSRKILKSVVAANVAALIAWQILSRRWRLSGIIFNDRKMAQFNPGFGRLHTLLMLQAVLNQNHSLLPGDGVYSNAGMLNDALRRVVKQAPPNSLVFLTTDASGCDHETSRLATTISNHSDLLVILVYDPQQADFCRPSRFPGDDALSNFDLRKRARVLREKNQSPAQRQRFLTGRFFPDGTPVIPLNTLDDVAFQLRRAFTKNAFSSLMKSGRFAADLVSSEAQT